MTSLQEKLEDKENALLIANTGLTEREENLTAALIRMKKLRNKMAEMRSQTDKALSILKLKLEVK